MSVGVAVLCEKVYRRLVFTARDELGLDTGLVQRVAQEQSVGGEADQPDGARRLHPHLAERRRQVVRKRSGIGLGPGQRRLDRGECGDGFPQLLNRPGRGGGELDAGDQAGDAGIVGRPVQRGYGFTQHQRPAAAGDDRQRIQAAGFGRRDPQVEFEHTAVGNTVVAGGIHPAGQGTYVVDTRRVGQE